MKKILEITKYYTAELDVDEFLDKSHFRTDWEDWKQEFGCTDENINEFLSEMMGEYGPPDEMWGYSNEKFDTWEARIYDN